MLVLTFVRLIVVAEKKVVYEKFPIPLINRLEKHFLAMETMLTEDQRKLADELQQWAEQFSAAGRHQPMPLRGNRFICNEWFVLSQHKENTVLNCKHNVLIIVFLPMIVYLPASWQAVWNGINKAEKWQVNYRFLLSTGWLVGWLVGWSLSLFSTNMAIWETI